MKTQFIAILALSAASTGCATEPSQHDLRGGGGKSDDTVDECKLYDWYADGVCDDFCTLPDPDCTNFERFVISEAGGPCPADADCSGFIELTSQRTLRQDVLGDPDASIALIEIAGADLAAALGALTDPALVAVLGATEPPCMAPTDFFEVMSLDAGGVQLSNSTTTCQAPELDAAREVMNQLAARYLPGSFVSFRIASNGFCAPATDCSSFVELTADGVLRQDRSGEIPTVVREATISAADLDAALAVVMSPDAIGGLAGDAPCEGPTDLHEVMTLTTTSAQHSQVTTFCDQDYLQSLRGALQELTDEYLPAR